MHEDKGTGNPGQRDSAGTDKMTALEEKLFLIPFPPDDSALFYAKKIAVQTRILHLI